MSELENADVGLDAIWGSAGTELHERLIDAPTVTARFDALETFLLSRPWTSVCRHPGVAAAIAAIEANPSMRMADVRDMVGMSTKRLIALFRAEIGLSPKAYARIRRLQAALRLLGSMSGAQVAAEVGYFDQAHFVREFPVIHRHDADGVHRTTNDAAQPCPRRAAAAAQISKTDGHGPLMIGSWTAPNTQ